MQHVNIGDVKVIKKKSKDETLLKPCCLDCAFLCRLRYSTSSELSQEDRGKLKPNDNKNLEKAVNRGSDNGYLSCFKAQLKTTVAFNPYKQGMIVEPLQNLSKKKCEFYYPYAECAGLTLDAVEQKQLRSVEMNNALTAKRTLKISHISLLISILAFLTSLCLGIINQILLY